MIQDTLAYLDLSPDLAARLSGNPRTRLVNFLLRWEQYETALLCLDPMLARDPHLVSLHDAKARALLGLNQTGAALETMQTRQQLRTSLSSRALEARVHLARGDADAALGIAAELTAENPDSVTAWGLLGEVHLARGDASAALSAYRRLADLNPDNRSYLLGMLNLHATQGDHVSASGYAVRLQRSADEGQALPAATLRRLCDYYRDSGEINRADDLGAQLVQLYQAELAELEAALKPGTARPIPASIPPSTATPSVEPLPPPDVIPVGEHERQRLEETARRLFGHATLLPGQLETMAAALRGQDVLTILPTGGGKSLCYQLPALLDERGVTLVISPLIALMKDQVDSLPPDLRRRATTINSTLEGDELRRRMQGMAAGRFRLVYAAPERLRQPPFLHALRRAGVNRLVIDEAHCVSVWGHDFRPDYLTIAQAREALGSPPLLAMTATAPPRVRLDILQRLGGDGMSVVAADVLRPNLYLEAIPTRNADEKLRCLLEICQSESGSGIVYAGARERCEQIAALLGTRGHSAGYYHAGIGDRTARAAAQDTFMNGDVRIMVATVAFGMGIDKPDIRFIVHLQLPPSLEAYYQEAGRAGRDNLPARCVLLYSSADRATLTRRARQDALPIEFLRQVYAAVKRRLNDEKLGRVAPGDLSRDVRAQDTPVRVALSMLEEAGLLRRHCDAPATAVVRLRGDSFDEAGAAFAAAARLRPGQSLPLDPLDVAQAAGLDPLSVEARLLAWADAGWLDYRPAGREWLLELLAPPPDAAARVQALIERYAAIQVQRVDEIAAYAATIRCRHGHIRAYLSGQPLKECQACDNCRPRAALAQAEPLPAEREQLLTILRCVAEARGGWGRNNLCHILRGQRRASEQGRRSPQWGALGFRSQAAVDGLIERLVHADMLRLRQLDHGGVTLELAPAGRAALQDPERLSSLTVESPAPSERRSPQVHEPSLVAEDQAAPVDEALFEKLRAWRLETAHAASVPPYVVAHDALLRRIAAARPQDEAQLLAIHGI